MSHFLYLIPGRINIHLFGGHYLVGGRERERRGGGGGGGWWRVSEEIVIGNDNHMIPIFVKDLG